VKSIVDQLDSLHENDPKLFWKTIDKLKKDTKTQENPISLSSWTTYLKELYDDKTEQLDLSQLEESTLNIKDLDNAFTCKEVKDSIKKLKKNKQPGIDLIHNECLIYGKNVLLLPIVNLFNRVLSSGVFPDT
jgi:pyruvate/oxaloacetate carboxyltransferase